MGDQKSAAETAIEELAKTFRKRVADADPIRYTRVHSGVLPCPQLVQIMSSDNATTNGFVGDPLRSMSAKDAKAFRKSGGALPAMRYFVTVRNIDTVCVCVCVCVCVRRPP